MTYNYSFQKYEKEKMARAVGLDLPISRKHSVEIINKLKNKTTTRAKKILEGIIAIETPIQYTRFNRDLGHKKGIGPGRFPSKTAENILKIINSVEKNANTKGLSNPTIVHMSANKAAAQWHYGRKKRRKMKRSHIEIVVASADIKEKKERTQKSESKPQAKTEKTQSKESTTKTAKKENQ